VYSKNLQIIMTLKTEPESFVVEDCRVNAEGENELLITFFKQKVWVNANKVKLCKAAGTAFCWRDSEENRYIELNHTCEVCPICLWWKCPHCGSCGCNKP